MKTLFGLILLLITGMGAPSASRASDPFSFIPMNHASMLIAISGVGMVYVDPVGESGLYSFYKEPAIILITHIHPDHLDPERIAGLKKERTLVIGPPTVIEKLGYGVALKNGEKRVVGNLTVEAVPAYNTTKGRVDYHPRGRDNGYILSSQGKRVYISGDTEDIPEMRALKDIDYAFICMNLPYTMTEEQAASALLEFRPRSVTPYHYRSKDKGISDLSRFKALVGADKSIYQSFMKWY